MRYVIIGAGIAGTTAANVIRKQDPEADITLITNEEYPLYARITIADYAAGTFPRERLFLETAVKLAQDNIKFLSGHTALSLNRKAHTVICVDRDQEQKILSYDKLLIATGGSPRTLDVKGADGKGIFGLYHIDDSDKIRAYLKGKKKGIVSGGASLAKDFANIFASHGLDTTLLIRGPRFMHKIYDEYTSEFAHSMMEKNHVHVCVNEEISEYELDANGCVCGVKTNLGRRECDIVGIGLGINRISPFIETSDLSFNNGVLTNEYLQTSDPDVFAAGDIAEYFDIYTHAYRMNGDWPAARQQGTCVGKTMTGQKTMYADVVVDTLNVFGVNISTIGLIDYHKTTSYIRETSSSYIRIITNDDRAIGGITVGDPEFTVKLKRAVLERKIVQSNYI